ncbi:hypothetical protein F5X68DRAFT_137856 [Plectosphaerella plurivora]|uniref:Uncharacterized protein n=1 Tax=Plectosphaerella plurivora TaxID=936078 RepID=A0A9P8V5V6_9PEZI|nr:hypothetical protein F5X68DRAFT_137856 [Plectosphaerella plurivora]
MASYEPIPRFNREADRTDVAPENNAPPSATPAAPYPVSSDQDASHQVETALLDRNSYGATSDATSFSSSSLTVNNERLQDCNQGTSGPESADAPDTNSNLGEALLKDPPTYQVLAVWKRIGITGCLLLAPCSLAMLLVLALLAKVWSVAIAAAKGSPTNTQWVYILESSRASSLVTICTALIRTIVTLQSGLATAMLASIIIERVGAPIWHIPLLSILRATASTPTSLISTVARRPRRRDSSLLTIQGIIVLEFLLVLGTQFFSTILLSDFKNISIRGPLKHTNAMVEPDYRALESSFWSFPSSTAYTFAENSENFVRNADFEDTGHTYRAFLPFLEEPDRLALRWYNGPAMVMDNRVVCISPSLDSLSWTWGGFLEGNVSWEAQDSFLDNGELKRSPFRCALPTNNQWRTATICYLNAPSWEGILRDEVGPPITLPEEVELDRTSPYSYNEGSTITLTLFTTIWSDIADHPDYNRSAPLPVEVLRQDGPWTILGNSSSPTLVTLQVSACLTGLGHDIYNVTMNRSLEVSEPKVTIDVQHTQSKNATDKSAGGGVFFNTSDVRHQLGAFPKPKSLEERGLLSLSPRKDWGVGRREIYEVNVTEWTPTRNFADSLEAALPRTRNSNDTTEKHKNHGVPYLRFSRLGSNYGNDVSDSILSSLYLDTLNETNSPALALQVVMTKLSQTWFYTTLPLLYSTKETEEVEIASSSLTFVPTRRRGLLCAVAIVLGHLVLVFLTAFGFAFGTQRSLIGNSWPAVSQVGEHSVVAEVLGRASDMRDEDVRQWVKERTAKEDYVMTLRRRKL